MSDPHASARRRVRQIRAARVRSTRSLPWSVLACIISALLCRSTRAQEQSGEGPTSGPTSRPAVEEADTSDLERLLGREIEVTSVSKKAEKRSDAAAAIFVITREDIRRIGARSIPEALRIVPGVEVAEVSAHTWAVTARGFNSIFANKLLVLVDGRSVYTPLFAGVFWDQVDVLLEDVDRIEVIRGPGATLWGSNAVNGIINIMTRSAKDTTGGYASGHAGSSGNYEGDLRYGAKIDDETAFRLYAKYFTRNGFDDAQDDATYTDWDKFQSGFRIDSDITGDDTLTVQGDVYSGNFNESPNLFAPPLPLLNTVNDSVDALGVDLIGRWSHRFDADEDITLQMYWDHTERDYALVANDLDSLDIDFQHHITFDDVHDFIWGVGYRFTANRTDPSVTLQFDPRDRDMHLFTAFAQDTITIVPDELKLTIGTKIEHNDFSGFEVQPNARIAWTPVEEHTVWASVTRAVRIPSRAEHDLTTYFGAPMIVPPGVPGFVQLRNNDRVDSESVIAYELGYRVEPTDRLSFDLALFYNDYAHLSSTHDLAPELNVNPTPYLVFPLVFANDMCGETYGVELDARWRVFDDWDLAAGYTYIDIHLHDAGDRTDETPEGDSPAHRFNVRSYWNVTENVQVNSVLYWTDDLPAENIPAYFRWDIQFRWTPCKSAELAVGVQNLLDDHHPEFPGTLITASEIERIFYMTLEVRF